MKFKLDDLDRSILKLMQVSGELTLKELSAKTNAPATTIDGRLKRLRENGQIKNNAVILDPVKLGLEFNGFIVLKLSDTTAGNIAEFGKSLQNIRGVRNCYMIAAKSQIRVHLVTRDIHDFNDIHDEIARIPTVYNLRNEVILQQIIENKKFDF